MSCTGSIETCKQQGGECSECGERDCPWGEPFHYHHDGCPACTCPVWVAHCKNCGPDCSVCGGTGYVSPPPGFDKAARIRMRDGPGDE